MKHTIGQIIYVVLEKELKVFPMQVVEIITKKTLSGEEVSYKVRGGTNPKNTLLTSELEGEIFDSSEKAREVLTQRAVDGINHMIDLAMKEAKEWYPGAIEVPSDDPLALLKKPPVPRRAAPLRKPKSEVAELAAEFEREAAEAETFVELPDGSRARVGSIKLPDTLS